MPSVGPAHRRPGSRCARITPRAVLAAALLVGFAGLPAPAAESVRFNEVTVPLTEQSAAFPEAMRVALVRATGRREAATDAQFQALVGDAARYVQIYRPARAGAGTQVTFDAVALERAIVAAGGAVWPRERPVALVVILQAPPGADPVAARRALEDAATARGLPLRLSSAQSAGLAGIADVGSEVALAAAQRAGADVALLARGDASGWRWSFHAPQQELEFQGGVEAGIEGAADALSAAAVAVLAQPEREVLVQVDGVSGLREYAEVTRLLGAATGVRAVTLVESSGSQASFAVQARGGADGLAAGLAGSPRLRPVDSASDRLVYALEP